MEFQALFSAVPNAGNLLPEGTEVQELNLKKEAK